MTGRAAALCLLLAAACWVGGAREGAQHLGERPGAHSCKELYYTEQAVDHFNARTEPQRWAHRYLLNDTYWATGIGKHRQRRGPIFFYGKSTGCLPWARVRALPCRRRR